MSVTRPSILDEADPRLFLDAVKWGWRAGERLQRLRFYSEFLARLVNAETHGERDALVIAAADIFGSTRTAIRRDLRAAEDLLRIEMMARMPSRPPRTTP